MKFYSSAVLLIIFLIISPAILAQDNSGDVMFQEALYYIEGTGDYEKAITLLNKIVEEHSDNQQLASQSLLHLGIAFEKLGMQEASRVYQRIIDEYSSQQEMVFEARSRLMNIEEMGRGDSFTDITIRQIWEGDGVDVLGRASPDGQYISFVDWATGDLGIRNLASKSNQRLTDKGTWAQSSEHALFSIYSPDGNHIAYSWWNNEKFVYELQVIDTETGNVNIILSDVASSYTQPLDWSPDGRFIVSLITNEDRFSILALVSLGDGSITILKSEDWWFTDNASFSPDGKYLAYDYTSHENDGKHDIYILDLDTKQETLLVGDQSANMIFSWTPDGNSLLFSSDRAGVMGVWKLPVSEGEAAGEPVLLKSDIGQTIYPMGLTERGDLYYGKVLGNRDVFSANLNTESNTLKNVPQKLSQTFIGFNRAADWSPDGRYVVYSSTRDLQRSFRSNTIVIHDTETGQERVLRPELNFIFDRVRWSPDGESVVVYGENRQHETGLFIIDSRTGEIETTIYSDEQERLQGPDFSPDGRYLYYFRNDFSAYQRSLIQRDLQNGKQTVLYTAERPESLGYIAISADGSRVAFRKNGDGESSIMVASINPDEVNELVAYSDPNLVNEIYDFFGDNIVYRKEIDKPGEPREAELWKVNALTGEKEPFNLFPALDNISNIRFHPHEDKIVFNMGTRLNQSVWKIENLLTGLDEE